MENLERPWTDAAILTNVLAGWRGAFAERPLFRVSAGPGWLRLHLDGDERPSLLFCDLPGARLVFRHDGRLPDALTSALTTARQHPLRNLLDKVRITGCGILPADRVVAIRFDRPHGGELVLLHRLFGARGNTTLLDKENRLLWSRHRPPHASLAAWPDPATFTGGDAAQAPADYDTVARDHLITACLRQALQQAEAVIRRLAKANARLTANLDRDLANADQGARHRRKAEALAANLHQLQQGAESVVLPDLTDGSPLTIALDPSRTPAANMEAWFRRARKADSGLAIIRERRTAAGAANDKIAAAANRLNSIAESGDTDEQKLTDFQAWRETYDELFPASSPKPRSHAADEPARPFRRYLIDGRWEVWVGRSSRENDELTHRAAHQKDIWLHAQGVAGSHVILRTGGQPETVPKAVLAKAAALAALNSKARHSGIVPVIHTEKRYVRKPRKSPPGTAVCLRDKSLFVKPGIANGVKPD